MYTASPGSGTLSSWNFVRDYNKYRDRLIEVARIAYRASCSVKQGQSISQSGFESVLLKSLDGSVVWRKILNSKRHAPPSLRPTFTRAMARYLITQDWNNIVSP